MVNSLLWFSKEGKRTQYHLLRREDVDDCCEDVLSHYAESQAPYFVSKDISLWFKIRMWHCFKVDLLHPLIFINPVIFQKRRIFCFVCLFVSLFVSLNVCVTHLTLQNNSGWLDYWSDHFHIGVKYFIWMLKGRSLFSK